MLAAVSTPSWYLSDTAPHESLPQAVSDTFDAIAATATAGAIEGAAGSQLRSEADWARLLSALSTAGLLPQTELIAASRDLALPASLAQLSRRINTAHAPPRADTIDGLLDGAVARVRHLHGLLAEWELNTLSAEHTARLLAMLEALRGRLAETLINECVANPAITLPSGI